ncbi:MAG: ELWxxDGT repeat protein [Rhodothermia bacterium]
MPGAFAILAAMVSGQARAQIPFLLRDINPEINGSSYSLPTSIVEMGGIAYFAAWDHVAGKELWRSDGTESGTYRVKDIFPGNEDSSPEMLTVVGGTLFFRAVDGVNGIELWKSDGTEAGTIIVKDIWPGYESSVPSFLEDVNGTLFFNAADSSHGGELWKSDGTEAGTVMVKDIKPGLYSSSTPVWLTNSGGIVFFSADDGSNGVELWKSDGSQAGTVMVKNISEFSGSSSPGPFTVVNGVLFFSATNYYNGRELWKSDGTADGTSMVKDIRTGLNISSGVDYLTALGDTLFFSADDGSHGVELWKSDGTGAGTVVIDIQGGGGGSYPRNITAVGSSLFFRAYDSTNGWELWTSDGELAGTSMVKDIRPGINGSTPKEFTDVVGTLFFVAYDATNGAELWKSDGTEGGTSLVKDTVSGSQPPLDFAARFLTEVNGQLFFSSADASIGGRELWKSDGTEAGTAIVKDIALNPSASWPDYWVEFNGELYFSANDGAHGFELWKSDGTTVGTEMVTDITPTSSFRYLSDIVGFNGFLLFQANGDMWKSDGSGSGTVFVHDTKFLSPVEMNGYIYFGGGTSVGGTELWRTDGTPGGTTLVKEILTGASADPPESLTVIGSTVFFLADDGSNGQELWKSDGTEAGTELVRDIRPGSSSSYAAQVTSSNGLLFFVANDGSHGKEVWVSDGTEAGTVLTKDIRLGSGSSAPDFLTDVGGTLFFQANTGGSVSAELWESDGTEVGTRLVKRIGAAYSGSYPENLISFEGDVVFSARQSAAVTGWELWKSDGTFAGTVAVKDIWPGAGSSGPSSFALGHNSLFFTANDGVHGNELWKTDGTEEGTTFLGEIVPGGGDGAAYDLRVVDGTLFMLADDGMTGVEPWAICVGVYYRDSDDDGFGDPADSTVACSCPTGYAENDNDCDDENGDIHPGASEVCDAADNDCDGEIDEPTFAGLTSAAQLGGGSCAIRLDWSSTTACDGTPVYNVYRSTASGFDPGQSNLQVACVAQSFWIDTSVSSDTTYFYVVRAENPSTGGNGPCYGGGEDDNLAEFSATPTACTTAAESVLFFTARAADESVQLEWLNPASGYGLTHVCWKTGSQPTGPSDGSCLNVAGAAGSYGTATHSSSSPGGISNGTKYFYGAWVNSDSAGVGEWSGGRFTTGRPFDSSGSVKWAYTSGATALAPSGIIPGDRYFMVSNDRILHSNVAGPTGGTWPPGWSPAAMNAPAQGRPTVVDFGTPTVPDASGASTVAFVGSQDGRVYAFDADTSVELWASPVLGDAIQASPGGVFQIYGASFDLVLVGTRTSTGASKLYGLDVLDGSVAWSFDNGGESAPANAIGIISSQVWVDQSNSRVYFTSRARGGGSGQTVWCLDFTASSANFRWSAAVGSIDAAPTLWNGVVYVGDINGMVYAFDADSSGYDVSPLWSYASGDGAVKGFVWADTQPGGVVLYFSTSGEVHAITDAGAAISGWSTPVVPGASPVFVIGDDLFVGASGGNGSLLRIDKITGAQLGSVGLGDSSVPKSVGSGTYDYLNDMIVVGCGTGEVFGVVADF